MEHDRTLTPHYTDEEIAEAQRAETWNRHAIMAAATGAAFYLAVTFLPTPTWMRILGALLVFFLFLFYLGTTVWVGLLRSERKRQTQQRMRELQRATGFDPNGND